MHPHFIKDIINNSVPYIDQNKGISTVIETSLKICLLLFEEPNT